MCYLLNKRALCKITERFNNCAMSKYCLLYLEYVKMFNYATVILPKYIIKCNICFTCYSEFGLIF